LKKRGRKSSLRKGKTSRFNTRRSRERRTDGSKGRTLINMGRTTNERELSSGKYSKEKDNLEGKIGGNNLGHNRRGLWRRERETSNTFRERHRRRGRGT